MTPALRAGLRRAAHSSVLLPSNHPSHDGSASSQNISLGAITASYLAAFAAGHPRLQELRLPYVDIPGDMPGFPQPGVSQNHEKFGCDASVDPD